MRRRLLALFIVLLIASGGAEARGGGSFILGGGHAAHSPSGGDVSVRAYVRSDGTYVAPHMRSAPDGVFNNNWTTKGNVNPYTGSVGTRVTPPMPSVGLPVLPTPLLGAYSAYSPFTAPIQPLSRVLNGVGAAPITPAPVVSIPTSRVVPVVPVAAADVARAQTIATPTVVLPCRGNAVRVSGRCVPVQIR